MGPTFEKNFSPLQMIAAEQSTFVCPVCTVSYPAAGTTSSFISGPLGGCFCSALSNSPMGPSLLTPPSGELQDLSFLCFVDLYGSSNHVPS